MIKRWGAIVVACLIVPAAWRIGRSAFRQDGVVEPQCGQYAILRLCERAGVPLSMEDVCTLLPPKPKGESLLEISRTLERIGFNVHGQQVTWSELWEQPLPLIAHSKDHFVVVERFAKGYVFLLDGSGQRATMAEQDFKNTWDGVVLTAVKKPNLVLPANVPAPRNGEPRIQFDTLFIDAGDVGREQASTRHDFSVENTGRGDLVIKSVSVDCDCIVAHFPKEPIPPSGKATISVDHDVKGGRGPFLKTVVVQSNDPRFPVIPLHITGYVTQKLVVEPESLSLGRVAPNGTAYAQVFIRYFSPEQLVLGDVKSDLEGLIVQVQKYDMASAPPPAEALEAVGQKNSDPYESSFVAELFYSASESQAGEHRGHVRIETNLPDQKPIELIVSVEVTQRIQPDPSLVFFGIVREGEAIQREVILREAYGKLLRIRVVNTGASGLDCDYDKNFSPSPRLRLSGRLSKTSELKSSLVSAEVEISGEENARTVRIPIFGYVEPAGKT
jgi:predicted double-glycine peptidase